MARKSRKHLDAATPETANGLKAYKAAAYIRLSVEDRKKRGDSVETQRTILLNYIAIASDIELHGFYIDNGSSGTSFERPEFKKMLEDVERGLVNCIIVKDLSRFGRNVIDTGYYIEKYLPALGCRFIAVNDDFDTDSDMNNGASVILPLKNVINEAYALDIGRKIKAQQRQAMISGEYVGARPPYGYWKAPGNCHKLVIDPATAPVVRRIYEMFLGNTSVNEIVLRLNEEKIATPSHYRKDIGLVTHEKLIGNGLWQSSAVTRILTHEVYIGDMVQGKSKTCASGKQSRVGKSEWIRVPDTHEPIISREAYAQVQERLKFIADNDKALPKKPYTPNIYRGKVFCGHCGGSMNRQIKSRNRAVDNYVFVCVANSRRARGSCVSYQMPEELLTKALLAIIQSYADAVIGRAIKLRNNSMQMESQRLRANAEISALRQEADKSGRMLKSLYENLVSGLITTDEYRDMREGYKSKTQGFLARASEIEARQIELDKQVDEYCELSDLIAGSGNDNISAVLVERLINNIRIFSDRSIEVDFSFINGFDRISEVAGNE